MQHSNNTTVKEHTDIRQNDIDLILNIIYDHLYDNSTELFAFPILPVISEPDPTGLFGIMRRSMGKMYRVHFLCAVCGNCGRSGKNNNGKGYKLPLASQLTYERLVLFKKTLEIADLLLQLYNVPFRPSVIADCALQTLSATAQQMTEAELINEDEIQTMRARLQAPPALAKQQTNMNEDLKYQQPMVCHEEFGATYIHWIRCLLTAVGEDLRS